MKTLKVKGGKTLLCAIVGRSLDHEMKTHAVYGRSRAMKKNGKAALKLLHSIICISDDV
jgi:hypothetical protein